jgi:hypothetical protein
VILCIVIFRKIHHLVALAVRFRHRYEENKNSENYRNLSQCYQIVVYLTEAASFYFEGANLIKSFKIKVCPYVLSAKGG